MRNKRKITKFYIEKLKRAKKQKDDMEIKRVTEILNQIKEFKRGV